MKILKTLFWLIATIAIMTLIGGTTVLATGVEGEAAEAAANGMKFLGAALSTGLACVGAGIAVAAASSSALGAISEDASLMGKTLIFVALAEGIALYGLLISFLIINS